MRELLAELRPSVLTDSSLGDLLRQLANAFTGRTNIPVSLNLTGEHILSAEFQVAFYRICQETLNNIAKHARATHVYIDLHYDIGETHPATIKSAEMRICDNGQGFDPDKLPIPGHYGMDMMRERAEGVGAQLTVTSQPGHGTEVTLCWPGTPKQEAL
jgi:signal transduction histidine kinase